MLTRDLFAAANFLVPPGGVVACDVLGDLVSDESTRVALH